MNNITLAIRKLICGILFFSLTSVCLAVQTFDVKDGDSIKVILSKKELSHLKIAGEGRIDKIWGKKKYLDLEIDTIHGEAYLKAFPSAPSVFSFFVKDDFGNVYSLTAVQNNVPSQTIILDPMNSGAKKPIVHRKEKSQPMKVRVNKLFKGMFKNEPLIGYVKEEKDEPVQLWEETSIRFIKSYQSHEYHGEVYEIKNITKKPIEFHESEFFDFGKGVIAAGVEHLVLKPGKHTRAFVVRRASESNGQNNS